MPTFSLIVKLVFVAVVGFIIYMVFRQKDQSEEDK